MPPFKHEGRSATTAGCSGRSGSGCALARCGEVEHRPEIAPGVALRGRGHRLRRAFDKDLTAAVAPFGTEVDDPVRSLACIGNSNHLFPHVRPSRRPESPHAWALRPLGASVGRAGERGGALAGKPRCESISAAVTTPCPPRPWILTWNIVQFPTPGLR